MQMPYKSNQFLSYIDYEKLIEMQAEEAFKEDYTIKEIKKKTKKKASKNRKHRGDK